LEVPRHFSSITFIRTLPKSPLFQNAAWKNPPAPRHRIRASAARLFFFSPSSICPQRYLSVRGIIFHLRTSAIWRGTLNLFISRRLLWLLIPLDFSLQFLPPNFSRRRGSALAEYPHPPAPGPRTSSEPTIFKKVFPTFLPWESKWFGPPVAGARSVLSPLEWTCAVLLSPPLLYVSLPFRGTSIVP